MLTTHLRARALQAGALLAVVVGGIVVAPAVALADEPEVQITNLQTEVASGGTVNMQYQVRTAEDDRPGQQTVTIQVGGDLRCTGGECGQVTQIDQNGRTFSATLKAPDVNAGETRRVRVEVTASINGDSRSADQTITVRGQDRPETVRQLSGKVRDADGKAVSGAAVGMQDSQGNRYQATSNGSGGFSFTSSDGEPIAPGSIQVGARKDDHEPVQVTVQAAAGRSVTVTLTLKKVAATASASPSASASASASAEPTEEAASEPVTEDTPATGGDQNNAANTEDGNSSLIYILGGLLLAAGVGAIVLLFLRRRNAAGNNGDDDDPTGLGGGPGVVPPSQGRFNDATRVAAPVGAGAAAATMVAPLSGAPSMADAPTMLHRPVPAVDDEFPDPYGAPMPQQGGYLGNGAAAGGWDDQADGYGASNAAYGAPTQYGRAVDDGYAADDGYGAAAGGYGDQGGYGAAPAEPQRRYDEPTGMYQPEQDAGYDDYGRGQQYGAAQPQYGGGYADPEPAAGPGGAYGAAWGAPGDGIDNSGNAYEPQNGGGQYGSGQQYGGGYGAATTGGYEAGGYGDQGGYGAAPAAGSQYGGGYEQPQQPAEGYDEQYDDQRGTYGAHPAPRRSNDWGN